MGGIKIKLEIVKFELSSNISTDSNYFHTERKFFTFHKQNLQRILPEFSKCICIYMYASKRTNNLQVSFKDS